MAIDIGIWRIYKATDSPDIVWRIFSDQDFTNLALKIGQRGNLNQVTDSKILHQNETR